jgi:hypothetical protein
MRIIALAATKNYGTGKARVLELAMRSFASIDTNKTRGIQVGDELTDLPRHGLCLRP